METGHSAPSTSAAGQQSSIAENDAPTTAAAVPATATASSDNVDNVWSPNSGECSAIADVDNWLIVDHDISTLASAPTLTPSPLPQPAIVVTDDDNPLLASGSSERRSKRTLPAYSPPDNRSPRASRRRSESALTAGQSPRRHFSIDDDDNDDNAVGHRPLGSGTQAPSAHSRQHSEACDRCGKRRASIGRHVARFKRQLESRNVSEAERRTELDAFLAYLEQQSQRTASLDEDGADDRQTPQEGLIESDVEAAGAAAAMPSPADAMDDDDFSFGDDDGIHVYGTDDPMEGNAPPKQFFNLTDIQDR